MDNKKPGTLPLVLGLFCIGAAQIFGHFFPVPDLFKGVLLGLGLGLEIMALVLMKKDKDKKDQDQ